MPQISPELHALLVKRGIVKAPAPVLAVVTPAGAPTDRRGDIQAAPSPPIDPAIAAYAQGLQGNLTATPAPPSGPPAPLQVPPMLQKPAPQGNAQAAEWQRQAAIPAPAPRSETFTSDENGKQVLAPGTEEKVGGALFAEPKAGPGAGPLPIAPPGPGGGGGGTTRMVDQSLIGPGERANLNASFDEQKDANDQLALAQSQADDVQGAAANVQAKEMALNDFKAQEAERGRQQKMQQLQEDRAAMVAQRANMQGPHDRRSVGARAVGAIAVALSELGNAIARRQGPNTALQIVTQSIDRDLDEQREALKSKDEAIRSKGEELQTLRERFGDERAADAAFQGNQLLRYKLEMEGMAQRAKSPQMLALAKLAGGELDQKRAQKDIDTHRFMPVTTGGGAAPPDLRKLYGDYYEKHQGTGDAAKPFAQWYQERFGGAGGAGVAKEEKPGKEAPGPLPGMPKSAAWDPTRYFQGTAGYSAVQDQQRFNARVLQEMHNHGARTPEAQEHIGAAYVIQPGDLPETIARKYADFQRDYPGAAGGGGGGAPASAADLGAEPVDQ